MDDPIAYVASRMSPSGRCFFVPNGGNLGDALIAAATIQRFERHGIPWQLLRGQRRSVTPHDLVVHGGGGSMVSLYDGGIECLSGLLALGAPVVVLPQSIEGHEDFWRRARGVTVFCRDRASLARMRRFDAIESMLGDDMAVGLDLSEEPYAAAVAVGTALRASDEPRLLRAFRRDAESRSHAPPDSLDVSALAHPSMSSAPSIVAHACLMLSAIAGHHAIETDRLHVAIAGGLLGIDTTLHDNSYGKNRAVFDLSLRGRFPTVTLATG